MDKKITLFHTFKGSVSGSEVSLIDLYYYLKTKINVKLSLFFWNTNFKSFIKIVSKNFEKPIYNFLNEKITNKLESDIIITTANILNHIKKCKFKLYCDKLIILDTTQLNMAFYNNKIKELFDIKEYISYKEIILLGNPSNKQFSIYVDKFIEHYHKFSEKRLTHIENNYIEIDKDLTTKRRRTENDSAHMATFKTYFGKEKIINNCDLTHLYIVNKDLLPHGCRSYDYQRWIKVAPNMFIENIGKLIFEFCYFNKPVYYSTKNKTINDGLHYYFKLFNIDDSIDQEINITRQEIIDNLVYSGDELILEILKD